MTVDAGKPIAVNHSTAYPAHLLFLDTETYPVPDGERIRHMFKLAWTRDVRISGSGFITADNWTLHKDSLEVLRTIEAATREKTALTVYGHNLWFDLQVCGFYHQFPRWGWTLEFIYDEGLTYLLNVRNGGRSIRCVSTTNYWDYSLGVLGKEIGLPKLDVDFANSTQSDLETYCRRDVEITAESVFKYMGFLRNHDSGRFAYTKASQAFNSYRHRFMNEKIHIHACDSAKELERAAYFGGRTECFRLGMQKDGPFTFLDINSMYPAIMKSHTFPNKILEWYPAADKLLLARWIGKAALVAHVTLCTDSPAYPVRQNGKTIFPIGTFETVLCTGGLERAWRRGELLAVHNLAVYSRAAIFRSYVDYWHPLKSRYKDEGNAVYTRMVKIFLNSLYGKFGERRWEEEWIEDWSDPDPWRMECFSTATGERWIETHLFNTTIIRKGQTEGPRAFVAIAAHVTEYARLLLWEIIEATGRQKVLYCDTDSLVLKSSDLHLVKHPLDESTLGALAVDKSCSHLLIHGCKDYEADDLIRLKGVPRKAVRESDGSYKYDQFLRSVSHLRLKAEAGVLMEHRTKRLARTYDKGIIGRGGIIRPFHLDG